MMIMCSQFMATVIMSDGPKGHNIPQGRWRDGLFDCVSEIHFDIFSLPPFHPLTYVQI
jgi:hypothetical protein